MPSKANTFDFTARELTDENFAQAMSRANTVSPAVVRLNDSAPVVQQQTADGATAYVNNQLVTSASVADAPQIGVGIYTVSDILQGAGLYRNPGQTYDQYNTMLTSDLSSLIESGGGISSVLGIGRSQFSPYDTLLREGVSDGKIQLEGKDGQTKANATFAGAGGAGEASGKLKEQPDGSIEYTHPNFEGKGPKVLHIVTWRGFQLAEEFMARWQPLVLAALADGVEITGSGWRSYEQQIALRKSHCGDGQFNIYEKRSSQCSPPTARPGYSNHEGGCAVDVSNVTGGGRLAWLRANAGTYQVYNLPSENWHWSIDGN